MIRSSLSALAGAALAGAACLALGSSAHAGVAQAGSLLVYPCFDTARGSETIITVTNQNDAEPLVGTVRVEFVYINAYNCQETNRTRVLTPNDTLTVLASYDNPNAQKGYVYVFAKDLQGRAIKFDHLIGASRVISCGDNGDYEVAPFVFQAGSALAHGALTDLDGDGIRDLNGLEYEKAPDQILIPRFIGQECGANSGVDLANSNVSSLVLVSLAGSQFTSILDFLIYNDNEEVFSAQYEFTCWKKVSLLHISGVFHNQFLLSTNQAMPEALDGGETGWMRIDGNVASSTAAQQLDPAFLALLIEKIDGANCAELPFAIGTQPNGDLLPLGVLGDLSL